MRGEDPQAKSKAARAFLRGVASMPTGVALLAAVVVAVIVGMVLPDGAARTYVYGRTWFCVLLGLLGLSLVAGMVRQVLSRSIAAANLLAHGGILLILLGAAVTLVSAERGAVLIHEGETVDSFDVEGGRRGEQAPLGFSVRLIEFRIERYPPADNLVVRRHGRRDVRIDLEPEGTVRIPGTDIHMKAVKMLSAPGDGIVEVKLPEGRKAAVPAKVGTTHDLCPGTGLEILRYEPSFRIDRDTKEVSSDAEQPTNPALQVRLVTDGKPGPPRWLFARAPGFRHDWREGKGRPSGAEMSFLHSACPVLEVEAMTPSGAKKVRIALDSFVRCPWDPTSFLGYERDAGRPKEYESEVEVAEEGRAVKRHVIRVNDPLRYRGTALHQLDYDREGLRWSVLGVSQDRGLWFVFAGLILTSAGLVGKLYLLPLLKRAIRPRGE